MSYLLFLLTLLIVCPIAASADTEWETWLEDIMQDGDYSDAQYEEMYNSLSDMSQNKININHTTRQELEALPFLSEKQVMDIMEYLDRYHSMKSLNELMSIESIDYETRQLLYEFLYVGEGKSPGFPSLSTLSKYGKNELSLYGKLPMYDRAGDAADGEYLGYKYKFWTRYTFSYSDYVKAGFVAAQDAGEPFFSQNNKYGFDQYSAYLMLKRLGRVEALVIGRYSVSAGMGLVMNNGFSIGKTSVLQNMGRQVCVRRPHTSASESGYLQGIAASFSLTGNLSLTPFLSYRKTDATLNSDGTISTLLNNNYHRTSAELSKKNNTSISAAGFNAIWNIGDFSLGATAVYTHLSRPLNPNMSATYKRIYPVGSNFFNASLSYSWRHYPFCINGETAISDKGAIATVNSLGYYLSQYVDVMGIYRFYSFRYNSMYSNAFSEGGKTQNEAGFYLGVNWHPRYGLDISAYTDIAYFAWPRYGVSQSTYASPNVLSIRYKTGNWLLSARYRLHLKQKDGSGSNLQWRQEHRARLSAEWSDERWVSRTQIDNTKVSVSQGYMLTQNFGFISPKYSLYIGGKYFNTDGYDSRLYSYERAMPRTFSYPSYFGHGIRYSLVAEWRPVPSLQFTAKSGVVDYFDRSTIGTSHQQINASSACDIELGMKWKW